MEEKTVSHKDFLYMARIFYETHPVSMEKIDWEKLPWDIKLHWIKIAQIMINPR